MDKRFKISKMLLDNYILILLMLIVTSYKGSNAFGFDSASSCSPNGKLSRRGRAQMLAAIPCDLTRQPYCNLPGAAYPWHAVRRFVHENQGLMKRMYGDVRHISVLRDEIRKNDIDIEDIEIAAERYSRSGGRRSSKYMQQRDEDYRVEIEHKMNDIAMETNIQPITTTTVNTLPDNDVSNSNADDITTMPNKALEATVNFKPKKNDLKSIVNSTGNENKITNDDSNLTSNSVYELPTLTSNEFLSPFTSFDNIEVIQSPQLNIEQKNITQQTPNTSTTLQVSETTTTIPATKTTTTTNTTTRPQTTPSTTITTKKATTNSYIEAYRRRTQYTNRYRPLQTQQKLQQQQQIYRMNTTFFTTKDNLRQKLNESEVLSSTTTTSIPVLNSTTSTSVKNSPSITTVSIQTIQTPTGNNSPLISATLKANIFKTNNQPIQNNSPTEKSPLNLATQSATPPTLASTSTFSFVKSKIELLSGEKLRRQSTTTANKPIMPTPSPNVPVTKPPVLRDGQLYQDTVKQEPAPVANIRGINACPVKEEVVAPFWANNTRGEILALLNLYPFEQYVHWEKCTHEHKQMYCRDGCRCEQQYRLHRLLAYDPHNECRGIFSDWFRFPSCCICKCYNVPVDFRATSRSPRMQSFPSDEEETIDEAEDLRHPIEIAEEEVKRAIYEHATEDWYRPRDDYDYAED